MRAVVVDFDNLSLLKVTKVFEQDPSKFVNCLVGPKFNSRARLGEVKNLTNFEELVEHCLSYYSFTGRVELFS